MLLLPEEYENSGKYLSQPVGEGRQSANPVLLDQRNRVGPKTLAYLGVLPIRSQLSFLPPPQNS
jgi:hypothetical protein